MADTALTIQQLENIFQSLTATLTGLDPNSGVRIAWPQDGAPGFPISGNFAFVRVTPANDQYIQQRETSYQSNGINPLLTATSYTRVHRVQWVLYSSTGADYADILRDGLYHADTISTLKASNLFMVLDVPAPSRIPELFNGQWWQRADLSARFNELVTRNSTVPYLASVNITVKSDDGAKGVIS